MINNKELTPKTGEEIPIRGVVPGANQSVSISRRIDRLLEEVQQLRNKTSVQPSLILYERVIKRIEILNTQGAAKISFYFACRNGKTILKRLKHELKYDGKPLYKKDVFLRVNSEHLNPELDTFGLRRIPLGKDIPYDNISILYINPQPPIVQGSAFNYEYSYVMKKAYRKILEGEEWTSHSIMHPTNLLNFSLKAPSKYKFHRESVRLEVMQFNGLEDEMEEKHVMTKFPPIFMNDDTVILWEMRYPKITYKYTIYFRIVPWSKSV